MACKTSNWKELESVVA
uniref:Uncharacterized protein n=1 Tax=Rhizophora mucronata TaxID=61149 RepID=A0A2P2J4D1_RHIMU